MIEPGSWRRRTRWTRLSYGLLAVAALALLVLDRPDSRPGWVEALRGGADDLAAPVMSGVSAPLSGVRSFGETLDRHWDVYRQNEELRAEIAELEGWRELALSLRDKVSAYEAILNIPGVETADPIAAWTVAESGGPFQHVRLMMGGEDKDLKPGYPVLTDRGLVGRLISVSARSSRILLLTDASSRTPVMTEDGRVRAVLIGDNTGVPRLDFATGDRRLAEGDRIVTSGDSRVFPRGLPVGVTAMAGDESWRVALYSSRAPIDAVWVYPHDPVPSPPPEAVTPVYPMVEDAPDAEDAEDAGDTETAIMAGASAPPGPAAQESAQPSQTVQTAGVTPPAAPAPPAEPAPEFEPRPEPQPEPDSPPPASRPSPELPQSRILGGVGQ